MLVVLFACAAVAAIAAAQAPQPLQVHGDLNQVMRGILFPNSNIIFTAQSDDPTTFEQADDPTLEPNPLEGMYNGWQAIENAGIAIAEAANLLTIPGRVCSNGRPVPIGNADWPTLVQGLRDAGMVAYKAGQAGTTDAVLEAADAMAFACANCHDKYRDVAAADRCM